MSRKSLKILLLTAMMLSVFSCAPVPTPQEKGPPPAQNLLGSTDELQLVAELSLNLVKKYGGDNVLVILGVDNTLLAGQEIPCTPNNIVRPLQADASAQVSRMQDAGLRVIAMTKRSPDCQDQTLQELADNGFDFSTSAWPLVGSSGSSLASDQVRVSVAYRSGVYFTGDQDKGAMLTRLLQNSAVPEPVLLVLVDSRQNDLNSVMKQFSYTTTKVQAWRYTRTEPVDVAQQR
jgi:hypothetical protein